LCVSGVALAIIDEYIEILLKLNRERILWLIISGFVCFSIVVILFELPNIQNLRIVWAFVITGIIMTVVWWYWTMMLIRKILQLNLIERKIIEEILSDIEDLRKIKK